MKLSSVIATSWPPLAWLARLRRGESCVALRHGRAVEVRDRWFAEAVWDGPFSEGDFDKTDLVFGSAGKAHGTGWLFVSSGTTVDRLHWHQSGDEFIVSNSLACLLAALDATVDPHRRDWFRRFESIIRGINDYQRTVPTTAGDVHLTYFRNLHFDGRALQEKDKPCPKRDFSCFDAWHTFMVDSMQSLGRNLADPARASTWQPVASLSTGYDSPTAAALARHAGLTQALTIKRAREDLDDDGSQIGRLLGLDTLAIERDAWWSGCDSDSLLDASRFIASDAKGEDVYFAPAADVLQQRVLFSGYSGSRVWDKTVADYSGLRRGDQSGLSHTEARLHAGYLHVPVPFFGGQQENDIRALGAAAEQEPWSIGGDYDRPLCRRVVEQAGVPRQAFGQQKKAASVLLFDRTSFLPPRRREAFLQWIAEQQVGGRNFAERWATATRRNLRSHGGRLLGIVQHSMQAVDKMVTLPVVHRLAISGRVQELAQYEPWFDYLFPWSLAETMQAYPPVTDSAAGP